ncbi:hypothetical protein TSOC_014535, partial [Tetrabaena socialis]
GLITWATLYSELKTIEHSDYREATTGLQSMPILRAGLDWFDEAWGPTRVVKALPCLYRPPVYSLPVGAGETALSWGLQPVSYSQCWPPAHLPQPGLPAPRPLAGPVPQPEAPARVADVGDSDGGSSDGGSGRSSERRSDSGSGSDDGEEAGWGDVRLVNYYRRFLLPQPPGGPPGGGAP